ncbi:MAG: hypothetical protein HOV79_19215 [Hamadaea sp.]|nr:hypothetical protein [Hamadaea sp.]
MHEHSEASALDAAAIEGWITDLSDDHGGTPEAAQHRGRHRRPPQPISGPREPETDDDTRPRIFLAPGLDGVEQLDDFPSRR